MTTLLSGSPMGQVIWVEDLGFGQVVGRDPEMEMLLVRFEYSPGLVEVGESEVEGTDIPEDWGSPQKAIDEAEDWW